MNKDNTNFFWNLDEYKDIEWNPAVGLDYVSPNVYNLACLMIEKGVIISATINHDENIEIEGYRIYDFQEQGQQFTTSTCVMTVNTHNLNLNKEFVYKGSWSITESLFSRLKEYAVYQVAGYIMYLRECEGQEKIDALRNQYRNYEESELKSKTNYNSLAKNSYETYDAIYKYHNISEHEESVIRNMENLYKDAYLKLTDEQLQWVESQQENNFVSFGGRQKNYGTFYYYVAKQDEEKMIFVSCGGDIKHHFCLADVKNFEWNDIIAFVDYLKRTFRYKQYLEQRTLYQKRKGEYVQHHNILQLVQRQDSLSCTITSDNWTEILKHTDGIKIEMTNKINALYDKKKYDEDYDHWFVYYSNKKSSELYGELYQKASVNPENVGISELEKHLLVNEQVNAKIEQMTENKIEKAKADRIVTCTMEELAIRYFPYIPGETEFPANENCCLQPLIKHFPQTYSFHTDSLPHMFIVTDLQSFFEMKHSREEVKKQRYREMINFLGTRSPDMYIVVIGTKKEIEQFLTLSLKINFLYQNDKIIIQNQTPFEMYESYRKALHPQLKEKLDDNFFKIFDAYIVANARFFPLANEELAKHLAKVANQQNDLKFPIIKTQTVEERLQSVVGMENVKMQLRAFESYVRYSHIAKQNRQQLPANNLHMLFTGNPGTGKTMIARIVGEILFDMGIISEKKVIEVDRKNLVAGYIGQTATKTGEVIKRAMGGVLFIDEAYSLTPKSGRDFGHEAIATLIKAMEDHKDNLVVIFAGYEKEMYEFVESNPGISSRIGYTFHFKDYSAEELQAMVHLQLEKYGLRVTNEDEEDFSKKIKEICQQFQGRRNFGNGRFVDKLVQQIIFKRSQNAVHKATSKNYNLLYKEDVPTARGLVSTDQEDTKNKVNDLDSIIGLSAVKNKLKDFEAMVLFKKLANANDLIVPNFNLHMLFTGNPGTGKTMMARIVAKRLFESGVILDNKVIEVDRKDLIANYIGETATKTNDVIQRAMGGVLFIDEAYSLTPKSEKDFGHEAIATLIKAMEDYKDNLVVIFAGYQEEMDDFVKSNPGIESRIGFAFQFENYDVEALFEIFENKLRKNGFVLAQGLEEKTKGVFQFFCNVENFGNGRFVDKVLQTTFFNHALRMHDDYAKEIELETEEVKTITAQDIPSARAIAETMQNNGLIRLLDALDKNEAEQEYRRVAIHEIGHAFMQLSLFPDSKVHKITIQAEGTGALGYVKYDSVFKTQNTKETYRNSIAVAMAGLAAEEVFLGEYADGGTSDIQSAKKLVLQMIRAGMSKGGFTGTSTKESENEEISTILGEAYEEAKKKISNNRESFEKAVTQLLKKKEIDASQLKEILFRD